MSPCQRCSEAGVRCEFRGDGLKRAPVSREYVTALENRIESLESFLVQSGSKFNVKQVNNGGMGISATVQPPIGTLSPHLVQANLEYLPEFSLCEILERSSGIIYASK